MTTLRVVPQLSVPPVPWTRLAWIVWRRYRSTLVGTLAVLALIAGYLVIDGLNMRAAYETFRTCMPADSAGCQYAWETFRDGYGQTGILGVVLLLLPGIVGAIAGAPLLARELETGSYRYTWTQSAGRMRWAAAMIVVGGAGVAVVMAAFGALVTWHDAPLTSSGVSQRLRALSFPLTGPAAAGWALLGFALGVLAGLLWRRVLAALVTAFATWFGLALAVARWLRLNYVPPLTTTSHQLSDGDVLIAQWWTRQGAPVSEADVAAALESAGLPQAADGGSAQVDGVDAVQYLLQHGYTQVTSYQPDSRYWPLQWIEFGWLVVLSVVLLAAALWGLRRIGGGRRGARRIRDVGPVGG